MITEKKEPINNQEHLPHSLSMSDTHLEDFYLTEGKWRGLDLSCVYTLWAVPTWVLYYTLHRCDDTY